MVSALFCFPLFGHEIGGKGGASPEHEHGLVQPDIRGTFIKTGVPDSLLVVCVAIEFLECFLERWMFQDPGPFKGIQRRAKGFVCSLVDLLGDGFDGMDAVGDGIPMLPCIDVLRGLT